MIELSLISLLNTMAPRYCHYKASGLSDTKSTLLAYSEMHEKYTPKQIQTAVRGGKSLETVAVAIVATTCPLDAIRKNDESSKSK